MTEEEEKGGGKLTTEGCQIGIRDGSDWTPFTNFCFEIECFVGAKDITCERTCIMVRLTNGNKYRVVMESPGKD